MNTLRFALGMSLLGLVVTPTPRAEACSPRPCFPGAFVPQPTTTVPANAPGFYWRATVPAGSAVDPTKATLVRTDAPTVALAYTTQTLGDGGYLIVPAAPLTVGEYRLADTTVCSEGYNPEVYSTFTVGPAAALPTSLGVLDETSNTRSETTVATVSGSCTSPIDAAISKVELTADASAQPWLPLLHYTTLLDGMPWYVTSDIGGTPNPGASWQGRGKDQIFVTCASDDTGAQTGTTEGTHVVTMEARLPGTSSVWTSAPVTIQLSCAAPDDEHDDESDDSASDGGCATGGTGSAGGLALVALALVTRKKRRVFDAVR